MYFSLQHLAPYCMPLEIHVKGSLVGLCYKCLWAALYTILQACLNVKGMLVRLYNACLYVTHCWMHVLIYVKEMLVRLLYISNVCVQHCEPCCMHVEMTWNLKKNVKWKVSLALMPSFSRSSAWERVPRGLSPEARGEKRVRVRAALW